MVAGIVFRGPMTIDNLVIEISTSKQHRGEVKSLLVSVINDFLRLKKGDIRTVYSM